MLRAVPPRALGYGHTFVSLRVTSNIAYQVIINQLLDCPTLEQILVFERFEIRRGGSRIRKGGAPRIPNDGDDPTFLARNLNRGTSRRGSPHAIVNRS